MDINAQKSKQKMKMSKISICTILRSWKLICEPPVHWIEPIFEYDGLIDVYY